MGLSGDAGDAAAVGSVTLSTSYTYDYGLGVAVRRPGEGIYLLLDDHLHSTAMATFMGGGKQSKKRYRAWGEQRYSWAWGNGAMPTTYHFTGQREDVTIGTGAPPCAPTQRALLRPGAGAVRAGGHGGAWAGGPAKRTADWQEHTDRLRPDPWRSAHPWFSLTYDAENRLVSYSGGGVNASFVYDGDGHRVKAAFNGTTTVYVGNYYEKTGSIVR